MMTHIILAWSKEDVERGSNRESIVIPLAPGGYSAALSSGNRIIDTHALIGKADERAGIIGASLRKTLADLISRRSEPWIAGCGPEKLNYATTLVLVWESLLMGIEREMGNDHFEIVPPQAFYKPSLLRGKGFDMLAMKVFWICFRSYQIKRARNHVSHAKPRYPGKYLKQLAESISCTAGYVVDHCARIFLYEERKANPSRRKIFRLLRFLVSHGAKVLSPERSVFNTFPKIKILLAGTQWTDSFNQAPLAKCLHDRHDGSFLWLTLNLRTISGSTDITPEEKSLLEAINVRETHVLEWNMIPNVSWIHPLLARMSDTYTCRNLGRILSTNVPSTLTLGDWIDVIRECGVSGLREKYERRSRLLNALSPRVVAGLSTLGDMAFIRSWARENNVPFVLFPHGIFPVISQQYHVDGDFLGAFGKIMADQITSSGISRAREVAVCGSMQFGSILNRTLKSRKEPVSQVYEAFLYLPGHGLLPFFPASMKQRYREIHAIHSACMHVGKKLIVREHPRGGKKELDPFVDELFKTHPGTITTSSEPSLIHDLSSAQAVITSVFDGATIQALLHGKIVVAYIEEACWNTSLELFTKLGCLVRNPEDLTRVLRIIVQNDRDAQDIYRRQRLFLDDFFEGLEGDPWMPAQELIEKALNTNQETIRSVRDRPPSN